MGYFFYSLFAASHALTIPDKSDTAPIFRVNAYAKDWFPSATLQQELANCFKLVKNGGFTSDAILLITEVMLLSFAKPLSTL